MEVSILMHILFDRQLGETVRNANSVKALDHNRHSLKQDSRFAMAKNKWVCEIAVHLSLLRLAAVSAALVATWAESATQDAVLLPSNESFNQEVRIPITRLRHVKFYDGKHNTSPPKMKIHPKYVECTLQYLLRYQIYRPKTAG